MIASIIVATALQQSPAHHVVVTSGDTLSGIAASADDSLSSVEADNPQIPDPNLIYPGQQVNLPGHSPVAAASRTITGKTWGVTYGYPNRCGDGDGDGWDVACGQPAADPPASSGHAVVARAVRQQLTTVSSSASGSFRSAAVTSSHVSTAGLGSYQACVITRESGGNPNIWNASGHYGLYQFSSATWAAAGGNSADFGHASVAEQNQVFASAYAKWGTQPWTPSDHC